jgi:hypothetical protein
LAHSLQIRNNVIDGEYDWNSRCSWSGVQLWWGAARDADPALAPPVLQNGVTVARNTIRHADGHYGGAIDLVAGWWEGPQPARWEMISNPLVFRNNISDISGPRATTAPPGASCESPPRVGLQLFSASAWRTVFYGNTCNNAVGLVSNPGTATVRHCPASVAGGSAGNCDCLTPNTDVDITASAAQSAVAGGEPVNYEVTITNRGAVAATKVTLTARSLDGIRFDGTSYSTAGCDGNVNVCSLGTLAPGGSITLDIIGWPMLTGDNATAAFAVTHDEGDDVVANDAAAVAVYVSP